ncbi:MAG: Na+/H+ antiporter subunit E [Planctomycetota bacterium]|nr:Na+/H+ antiporter subunit E [Planctomycetota bacterium]
MRLLILSLAMGAFWFALSGHTEPLILGCGAASIAIVAVITHRMGVVDREGFPFEILFRALAYSAWLGVQILQSSLAVAKVVLSPRMSISPRLVRVPLRLRTDLGRAIYANSITATPGTVCINVWDDHLVVHALDEGSAQGLVNGDMEARVAVVECSQREVRRGEVD